MYQLALVELKLKTTTAKHMTSENKNQRHQLNDNIIEEETRKLCQNDELAVNDHLLTILKAIN